MTGDGLGLGASTGDGAEVVVGAILFVWACIFSAPTDEEGIGVGAIGMENVGIISLPQCFSTVTEEWGGDAGIVVFRAQQAHVSHGVVERGGDVGI
ncbi:unnamed protein product [Sphenostylis stenocarpa]|uniref:Uncharacterized protein n=1 Tax=Sphenostylis stenocarpa TaxID=92480 RepID=A0AA86VTS8_9FABA|nr:unnamed protein product [Sphenostylis stenocarpa]